MLPLPPIQKLKCLQIGDQDKINNSWDLDLDKINYFTINQPELGNKKSNPRSQNDRKKPLPYISRVREK
jgi:hypothetical protein